MTAYTCDYMMNHVIKDEPWVEYVTHMHNGKVAKVYGFRIICKNHRDQRGYRATNTNTDEVVSDCPLNDFLTDGARVEFYDMISDGKCDLKQAMKLFKRLYIPGFEAARIQALDLMENWHFRGNLEI